MALKFDATLKDIAIGHGDPPESVTDLNFQSGPDPTFDRRVLLYAAVLFYRYHVPVHTVAVLLRPEADSPVVEGKLRYAARRRRSKMQFSFDVLRMWQQPVGRYLRGPLGTLPLAPLCRLPPVASVAKALPGVIHAIDERLRSEATEDVARQLMMATFVLTGLRVTQPIAEAIFRRVTSVRESSTYMGILEEGRSEGRLEGMRDSVILSGKPKFGAPGRQIVAAVKAVSEEARLKRWLQRVHTAENWDEVIATP